MCICKLGFVGNGIGPSGCTYIDACRALRCRNNGTCSVTGTTPQCNCPPGTSPPLCDFDKNPCEPNPCFNGGNCTSPRGRRLFNLDFYCKCKQGFFGDTCKNQIRKCGGVRTALNGTIRYPELANETYSHNSRCAWLIKTNHTKVLKLTFSKFSVELSADCRFDWLQV